MLDVSDDDQLFNDRINDKEENICRDFIRGICDRKYCKYKHDNEPPKLNFCHDFQNNICPRSACKFIHCSPEEEQEFKQTGAMSLHIVAEATRKNQLPGTPPICNQYRKGACRRLSCKYRHLTKEEENAEICEMLQINTKSNKLGLHRRSGMPYSHYDENELCAPKKRFLQDDNFLDMDRRRFKGYYAGSPPTSMLTRMDTRALMLEEENSVLHKEISQLKRQVSDLTATNEFLLDQNASLRVSNKRNESVPAVTITNTNSPQVIRTVAASVATVPVSLATVSTCNPVSVSIAGCPSVSMAPPAQLLAPSQQILVTTNPSTQLAIANSSSAQLAIAQQNLANNLAQQGQPQLTTTQAQQLALATTTQQLALANTSQQLSSQPQPLTLAGTQQTHQQLASQAQAIAASQQLTTQQAQQLALANTSQLTSQAQQLALANTPQHLTVASVPQQLTLASTSQQLLAQQNITSNQQIEIHRTNQISAINSSQAIAISNPAPSIVSYPIVTQQTLNGLTH